MTRVTIQMPALRGKITIAQSESDPFLYIAVGTSYEPITFQADSLAEALQQFFTRLGSLQYTPENKAKRKAAADRMRSLQADRKKTNSTAVKTTTVSPRNPTTSALKTA